MKKTIRILVTDDHAIVRKGLITLITSEPGMEIVGEAADGVEAIEPLCRGFSFSPADYVKSPMARDFFFVTPRSSG